MLDGALPHSIEAEQALLGAVLISNRALERIPGRFGPEHFHVPLHARIWSVVAERYREGKVATPVTIKLLFAEDEDFQKAGGPGYLAGLVSCGTTPAGAADHAETILELAERRGLIDICQTALAGARSPDIDYRAARAQLEAAILSDDPSGSDEAVWLSDTVRQARSDIANAARERVSLAGLPLHIEGVDDFLGLRPINLAILAGRPSMGKTALALWTAIRSAQDGLGVYFVSLEMGADEVSHRAMSMLTAQMQDPVEYERLPRTDELTERELTAITRASLELQNIPFLIAPRHVRSVGAMLADIRRAQRHLEARKAPLGLIVVDYLQLLNTDHGRRESRVVEITEISGALKAMAMQLNLPVLALSQLSRKVEDRDDKRPQLSDLRDSGAIEQDANAVIFAFREDYYVSRMEPKAGTPEHLEWQSKYDEVRGKINVIVAKNRSGRIGSVETRAQMRTNSFL